MDLVVEPVARAACARAERVPTLDHEPADHAVEDRAVVQTVAGAVAVTRVGPLPFALGQLDEVGHRLGRVVGEQLQADVALAGGQGGVQIVGHSSPRGIGQRARHPCMTARTAVGNGCRGNACSRDDKLHPEVTRVPQRT